MPSFSPLSAGPRLSTHDRPPSTRAPGHAAASESPRYQALGFRAIIPSTCWELVSFASIVLTVLLRPWCLYVQTYIYIYVRGEGGLAVGFQSKVLAFRW